MNVLFSAVMDDEPDKDPKNVFAEPVQDKPLV